VSQPKENFLFPSFFFCVGLLGICHSHVAAPQSTGPGIMQKLTLELWNLDYKACKMAPSTKSKKKKRRGADLSAADTDRKTEKQKQDQNQTIGVRDFQGLRLSLDT